ncbi:MAG: PASTA domain-containing protein [Pseudomonadota bacterium]
MKLVLKYCFLFAVVCLMAGMCAYLAILAVTQSPEKLVLPDLVEKDLAYVLETLTGLGLNTKLQGTEYSNDIPRNHVLTQFPEPGTFIKKGRDVMIRISKGKNEMPMPDLEQISFHKSELLLENTGLVLGTLTRTYSDTVAKDAVITQYPEPGTVVPSGSLADILVSRGPRVKDHVMPDISGMTLTKAETRLSALGLSIGNITTGQTNILAKNTIMDQSPLPGSRVPEGTLVDMTVNRDTAARPLTADDIQGVTQVTFYLEPGFLNKHVRIEGDLFGTTLDLLEGYMPPGQEVSVLIPRGITADIRVYIDEQLVKTQRLTPWTD